MRQYLMVFAFVALLFGLVTSVALLLLDRHPWWLPGLCGISLFFLCAIIEAGLRQRDLARDDPPQLLIPPVSPQNVRSYVEGRAGQVIPPRPVPDNVAQMPPRPRKKPPSGGAYPS